MTNRALLAVTAIALFFSTALFSQCPEPVHPDYNALMALYNATDGPNWTGPSGTDFGSGALGTSCNPCNKGFNTPWFGVFCNGTQSTSRVIAISLDNNGMNGTLPPDLGDLSELIVLQITDNSGITGSLPSELENLQNLVNLTLRRLPNMTGGIPTELVTLSSLQTIILNDLGLTGPIPPEIGAMTQLKNLDLSENSLSGGIPPEFGSLTNLTSLIIYSNQLTGSLPPEIGNMTSLVGFDFSRNSISGSLIPELGELENLVGIIARKNQLTGCYPENYIRLCPYIGESVEMGNGVGDEPNINMFDADFDEFCDFGAGTCTEFLCPGPVHPDLPALLHLYEALDGENWTSSQKWQEGLEGTSCSVCEWEGVTCENGRVVKIERKDKGLSGELANASALGGIQFLRELNLSRNQLTGPIPDFIGDIPNLEELNLERNSLNGTLPISLANLTELTRLKLKENALAGCLEIELQVLCLQGTDVDIDDNLYGYSWDDLCEAEERLCPDTCLGPQHPDYDAMVEFFNSLNGPTWKDSEDWKLGSQGFLCDPCEWEGVTCENGRVTEIKREKKGLSGSIPSGISQLDQLEELKLKKNDISGVIPQSLGTLSALLELDLSENELTGSLPASLASLPLLEDLDVSRNQLSGCIDNDYFGLCGNVDVNIDNNDYGFDFDDFCDEIGIYYCAIQNFDPENGDALYEITVEDKALPINGESQLSSLPAVRIFPNPTDHSILITSTPLELEQITVFDLLGNEVMNSVMARRKSSEVIQIDMSGLDSGMYLIRTVSQTNRVIKR